MTVTDAPTTPMRRPSRRQPWMNRTVRFAGSDIRRGTLGCVILGLPALAPLAFTARPVIEGDHGILTDLNADVLGSASMLLLLATLAITPLVTLTGARWFVPLRRWYGIVLGVTATTDAVIASVTSDFTGGVPGRMAGHTFLLAGLVMVLILIPLTVTAATWAQRWLGYGWKVTQRLTYVVWAILLIHLMLLEGIGFQTGTNGPSSLKDGTPVLHQRVYQLVSVSLILFMLRLPFIRHWVIKQRQAGRFWLPWLVFTPLIILAILGYIYILNEEFYKGIGMFRLQPPAGD